jgi:hypothetical protein
MDAGMKKESKKWFKKRVDWFIDNKSKMGSYRKNLYVDLLLGAYGEYLPYSKYEVGRDLMIEYINKRIRKRSLA